MRPQRQGKPSRNRMPPSDWGLSQLLISQILGRRPKCRKVNMLAWHRRGHLAKSKRFLTGRWSAPHFDCSPRKADGRRVLSTEFKRETAQRILTGEKTLAELSRELDIAPSVIRNWKRFAEEGATTAMQASEDVVPASQLREAYAKIRELERALGRKTVEVEILIVGRLTCEAFEKDGQRGYRFTGQGTYDHLLPGGAVSPFVVTPASHARFGSYRLAGLIS